MIGKSGVKQNTLILSIKKLHFVKNVDLLI
jgi:hypothetical protein